MIDFFGIDTGIYARGLMGGDMFLLFAIIVAWPIYTYINIKRHPIEKIRDDPNIRMKSYNESLVHLWGAAGAVLLVWLWAQRPLSELGFQHTLNWQTGVAWSAAALFIFYSASQYYLVHTSENARKKIGAQLRDVGEMTNLLMPRTDKEHGRVMMLAITAGITEEIIFRGYLIWALALFTPIWLAGIASIGIFALLHIYQEKAGLIQVTFFAIIATIMFILSGSLWPVIILHVGVDIINISLARKVSKEVGF